MSIHSCGYYCQRPECIKAQRDELVKRLELADEPVLYQHKTPLLTESGEVLGYSDWKNGMAGLPDWPERSLYTRQQPAVDTLAQALEQAKREPLTNVWVPVTQALLNEQQPWMYEPIWIALKNGKVVQGYYEWRQGQKPDRFITDNGDEWALDADYVMPISKPAPPQPAREWVGLTDEDLSVCDDDGVIFARYWEAKLKEKNT